MPSFFDQSALTGDQAALVQQLAEILQAGTNVTLTVDTLNNTITITGNSLVEITGFIEQPSDKTFTLIGKSRTAFTINTGYFKSSAGTANVDIAINGTNVTGLTGVAVSSTASDNAATANNVVAEGDRITLTISSVSGMTDFEFDIKGTR